MPSSWAPSTHQDVVDRINGLELGSAMSSLTFDMGQNAWADVPGVSIVVPAGIPWTALFSTTLKVTNGTPAPSAAYPRIDVRVTDYATTTAVYGYAVWVATQGLAGLTQTLPFTIFQDNDPLTADTAVKVQMFGTTNANVTTYGTFTATPLSGSILRAVRR